MNTFTANKDNARKLLAATLAAVCLPALMATAHAADVGGNTHRVVVHFADLNLARQADVATLYHRIEGAAKRACGAPDARELARAAAAKPCIDQAVAGSVARINSPLLTRLYATKTGGDAKLEVARR
jgi:UrcA family protein